MTDTNFDLFWGAYEANRTLIDEFDSRVRERLEKLWERIPEEEIKNKAEICEILVNADNIVRDMNNSLIYLSDLADSFTLET